MQSKKICCIRRIENLWSMYWQKWQIRFRNMWMQRNTFLNKFRFEARLCWELLTEAGQDSSKFTAFSILLRHLQFIDRETKLLLRYLNSKKDVCWHFSNETKPFQILKTKARVCWCFWYFKIKARLWIKFITRVFI